MAPSRHGSLPANTSTVVTAIPDGLLALDARQALTCVSGWQDGHPPASTSKGHAGNTVTAATPEMSADSTALALSIGMARWSFAPAAARITANVGDTLTTDHGITARTISEEDARFQLPTCSKSRSRAPQWTRSTACTTSIASICGVAGSRPSRYHARQAGRAGHVAVVLALAEQAAAAVATPVTSPRSSACAR